MGRWLAVRFAAFGLRHRIIDGPALWRALEQAFPHRDGKWRYDLAGEAIDRSGLLELEQIDRLEQIQRLERGEPPATQ